ncbi:MAG: hypothetical protein FWD36_01955 [Treponema sp.]|nr:hypothetical protein [Treponema sp.]
MSDFESNYPSTETLTRLRNTALFYLVGGLLLAAVQVIARQWIIAGVIGLLVCAVGLGWLLANNPNNKKTGALLTAVGVIVMFSKTPFKVLTVVMGSLLSIATIGFLVLGVKHLILYFIAQSKRR